MFAFLMSLIAMFMPAAATTPAAPRQAPASFAWLDGTWRTDALEMTCKATEQGTACREDGRGDAMKGAAADLNITPAVGAPGSQLKVTVPNIPASVFREVARDTQSVTYEMQTKMGIARLRFTREGDTLKVERGNDKVYATTMTYQRG